MHEPQRRNIWKAMSGKPCRIAIRESTADGQRAYDACKRRRRKGWSEVAPDRRSKDADTSRAKHAAAPAERAEG